MEQRDLKEREREGWDSREGRQRDRGESIEKQRHEGEMGVRNRGQRVRMSGMPSTARYQRKS